MSSQKPWYEKDRSCSTKRPYRTRIFRAAARFLSSSSRRVLPIPGSPATTANWHSPAIAAFRRRWSSANSFSRPMKADIAGRWMIRLAVETTDIRNSSVARLDLVAAEGLGDLAGLLRPLGRVLLEAAQDDVLELLADLGAERARRLRDLVDDAVEDRLDLAGERRLADEALVEDDAERVDVRAAVEGARGDLLGREVRDRADERARLRQPRLGRRVREAEVHDADADGRRPPRA